MTTTTPATGSVLPLAAATDHRIAGRKAATLARLAAAGFPVPPGVVIPAAVPEDAPGRELSVPADVAADLLRAVRAWGDVPLAVRSSGVDEDGADASYAGLFTSVLGVHGDRALLDAVRACWRSAFDARVTSYAGSQPLRPAVLVQPMVAARAAGVAFTADPVTGERGCVLIDAVVGLGDRLVSGAATPDRWTVRGDDVRQHSTDESAIDEPRARSIAVLAWRVEAELGGPQDIEWALVDDQVILLQARPVTALPAEPVPVPVEVPPGYWMREASHAPLPWLPFTRTWAGMINAPGRRMATELGLLFDGVDMQQIGGWAYVRIVPLGGKEPPRLPNWLVPVVFRLVPALRRRIRGSVAAMRSDVPGQLVDRWSREWQPDFDARIRVLRERRLAALSDTALDGHLADVLTLAADGADVHFRLHGALAMVLGEFAFTCRDLLGWDETRMFSLLCGTSTTSTMPARALADVAALAGPRVRALLAQGAPADEVLAADQEFAAAVAAYLGEFGCRALAYELSQPSLEERPDLLLGLVRDVLDSGFDPGADQELARRREAAANTAREILAGAELRRFERALQRALAAYPVREDNEFFTMSAPLGLLRRAALELGRRLAERGQIAAVEDVFFLHAEEARTLLADGADARHTVARRKGEHAWVLAHPGPASYGRDPGPPPPLRGLPDEARLANEAFLWTIERILASKPSGGCQGCTLTGIAASPGRYTGPVRIIRSEAEFDRLRAGDVLVCPATSPVWSVLFPSIGALVTDHGGTLSHPAIIAREYRVPAVVATCVGTAKLHDGQLVSVDGTTGTVEVLA
ncbi:MAG TPA: PEP/pyruvate-binding domain-containing protein [Kribbellaceae bacterium]